MALRKPGKPALVARDVITEIILKCKANIINNNCIVPATNEIWTLIAAELKNKLKPSSIHSMVVTNRHNLKNILFNECDSVENMPHEEELLNQSNSDLSNSITDENLKINSEFILTFGKEELDNIIMETVRKGKNNKKDISRIINVLKPNKWTETVSKKVCDSSRALLTACCRAFTGTLTIEDYAEAVMSSNVPNCYIRIDVAHYIKNWADFLKTEKKAVKQFYLLSIGKLIVSTSQEQAAKIIKALFVISLSETAGNGSNAVQSSLNLIQNLLKYKETVITNVINELDIHQNIDDANIVNVQDIEENIDIEMNKTFSLQEWGLSLKREAEAEALENGDDINPRYCIKFANRLLNQLNTLPLWSCIKQNKYGYGQIPASSAPVESEYKNIKKLILPSSTSRIDKVIETLVRNYDGKLKIIDTKITATLTKNIIENTNEKVDCMIIEDNLPDITENSSNTISHTQIECPACEIGSSPTGAHICIICEKKIHIFCSKPIDGEVEGYGEKRLCFTCYNDENSRKRIASKEIENWGGLAQPKKKRACYINVHRNDILQTTTCKRIDLPIIKNGNCCELKSIRINNAKISLSNTCAFDSIFQILLISAAENSQINEYLHKNKIKNKTFALVLDVLQNGIRTSTYIKRAEILLDYLKKKVIPHSIELIDCSCNVDTLARSLFASTPSFVEELKCINECEARKTILSLVLITKKELRRELENVLTEHIILNKKQNCWNVDCNSEARSNIREIGDIILIGFDTSEAVPIFEFPTSFELKNKKFKLIGMVNYIGPDVTTRRSTSIGHYNAICKNGSSWTIYDDLSTKKKVCESQTSVTPELIIYTKYN